MPRLRRELAALGVEMSNASDADGVDYGKSVFDVVRHPILKSLDPKGIIKFVDAREEYELEVNEKRKKVPTMTTASYKLCVKPRVLRSMHFMGVFDSVAQGVAVSALTSEQIKKAIGEAVTDVRKKSRIRKSSKLRYWGSECPCSSMTRIRVLDVLEMRVRQFVVDYLERMENVGYGSFRDDNPKKTVVHLIDALYAPKLKALVKKDLEYRPALKKDVKAFIAYVMEQAERIDRSRDLDSSGGTSRKPKSGKNKGSSTKQEQADEKRDEDKVNKGTGSGGKGSNKDKWKPMCLHPTCAEKKLRHFVKDCTECKGEAEKNMLLAEHREKKKSAKKLRDVEGVEEDSSTSIRISFAGKVTWISCADLGSDINLMPSDLLSALLAAGADMIINKFNMPRKYGMAVETSTDHEPVYAECNCSVTLTIELHIRHGTTLTVRNVTWLVSSQPTPEPLLCRPLLEALGLDAEKALEAACDKFNGDVDLSALLPETDYKEGSVARLVSGIFRADALVEDNASFESEENSWLDLGEDKEQEISTAFRKLVQDALLEGMSMEGAVELEELLNQYRDVFRLRLGKDPPADVEPMRMNLDPIVKPVITKPRRYSTPQRAFIAAYTEKLHEFGAAAPLLVPKEPPANFRVTLDYRPVNAATEDTPCPIPHIESELQDVAGSAYYAKMDFCSGYWELPLHEDSQDALSFMTPSGLWKPLQTTQRAKKSAPNFQSKVEPCFAELRRSLMAWLDDFLLHSKTEKSLLALLEQFFAICRKRRLKLSARKCEFFRKEVRWCGRIISAEGMQFDLARLSGLQDASLPETAGELCQYVHCLQWMSLAIPDYTARVAPLRAVIEEAYSVSGKRSRRSVKNIPLSSLSWGPTCIPAFHDLQDQLRQSVKLSHRKEGYALCLYTDASEEHRAGVVTQCAAAELNKSTEMQNHEPLAFVGSSFKGAQANWSTFEKEAFAIYQTMKKLDYLFICDYVHIYKDHLNLLFIYSPTTIHPNLGRHIVSKVQRWGLCLAQFQYTIQHVRGEKNVMTDIMTRWYKSYRGKRWLAVKYFRDVLADNDIVTSAVAKDFEWPTAERVREAQRKHSSSKSYKASTDDGLLQVGGKMWIPSEEP